MGQDDNREARKLGEGDLFSNRALTGDDPDGLGHKGLARPIVDTLTTLDPPLNLALFGPWGSGKTSLGELIRRECEFRTENEAVNIRFVRYDASIYGGEALKRNIISFIADHFEFDREEDEYKDFYAGLYETSTSTDIKFENLRDQAPEIFKWAFAAFAFIVVVSFVLIGLASGLAGQNISMAIKDAVPKVVAPTSFLSVLGSFLYFYAQSAKVIREESRPSSDEQFSQRFEVLIGAGKLEHEFDRLVVFIDELDRCSEKDVAATLTAIRTFLEVKPCVFIVAADRDVLERSLSELPQKNPSNETDPYYSAAREYFDKVFHDRISIPPIRHQSLYVWATDQVEAKNGGLWEELRNRLDQQAMGKLLFDLVPSHVSSPRRVRSLLNSFARTVAVAESRGVPWEGRELEVAKLVVLESEFPHLGRDLRSDHRLPGFILQTPKRPTERIAKLLVKYGADFSECEELPSDFSPPELPKYSGGDTYLAGGQVAKESEYEDLIRYLDRTSETTVSRDLIFMEHAGQSQGMDDPELGLILESALDSPDEVVERFVKLTVEERQQALVVLASMLRSEGREESRMYFQALTGIANDLLPGEIGDVPDQIGNAVTTYIREQPLDGNQILPVFEMAMASTSKPFKVCALDLDGLLHSERVFEVALELPRVPENFKLSVYEAISKTLGHPQDSLSELIERLPTHEAKVLIANEGLKNSLLAYVSGETLLEDGTTPDESVRRDYTIGIFDALECGDLELEALDLAQTLAASGLFVDIAFEWAKKILPRVDEKSTKNGALVRLMQHAPYEEVATFGAMLESDDEVIATAEDASRRILVGIQERPDLASSLAETAHGLLQFIDLKDETIRETIESSYWQTIESRTWWDSAESADAQHELHTQIREVRREDDDAVNSRLVQDLSRARPSMDYPSATAEVVYGIRTLGASLVGDHPEVLELTRASQPEEDLALSMAIAHTRYYLLSLASPSDRGGIDYGDAKEAAQTNEGLDAERALVYWFSLNPSTDEVQTVLSVSASGRKSTVGESLANWCGDQATSDLTDLAIRFAEQFDNSDLQWVEILLRERADDTTVTRRLVEEIAIETNGKRRRDKAAYLAKVGELGPDSQRAVADLMLEGLRKHQQVDFDMALDLIPALGSSHKRGGKLAKEFKEAAKRGSFVSDASFDLLQEHGVQLPEYVRKKKSRSQRAIEGIAGKFRR